MYYYYNTYYMIGTIFVIIAAILSLIAQARVQSAYRKYQRIPCSRGITGYQVAREILNSHGLYDIDIYEVKGQLSDHYNPSKQTINLSTEIYHGHSIASLAVAAHECGHAIQYQEGYMPIAFRNAILPFANAGQYLGWIAIMIGLLLGSTPLAMFGFVLMCGILAFQMFTLPVEFDASSRALEILQQNYLLDSEYDGAKKMLNAAALTYVAALISTLMSMLRIFLMIMGNSRGNRR